MSAGGPARIDDRHVRLVRHAGAEPPPAELVRIVGVLPFLPSGEIVAVIVDRGIDIPSGHVEPSDANPEAAVRREAEEEAGITLGPLVLLAHFRAGEDYIAVYTAPVTDLAEFRPAFESSERLVLTPEEFCLRYRPDEVPLFRVLLAEARRALRYWGKTW